jgi:phosphopantetheinyl transferase
VPLFYQQDINEFTRLGVWHITEEVDFFLQKAVFRYPIEHPSKQRQHLAAAYLLPELFHDFPLQSILSPSYQKPFLPGNPYYFSLSHTNEYAAAIVSRLVPSGIDIEKISPRVQRIRHKFLSAAENGWVSEFSPGQQDALLTLLWTIKETVYKWLEQRGLGFSEHIEILPFELDTVNLVTVNIHHPLHRQTVQVSFEKKGKFYLSYIASQPLIVEP